MKKEKYKKIKTIKIKKGISTISKTDWDSYCKKNNWDKVYNKQPLKSLGFRNGLEHIIFGCVASGTNFYGKNDHCGGIDHISYSKKENIYKIDRFAILPTPNTNELEIVMLDTKNYKKIHHITIKEELLKEYPHLKIN